jgi:hypothetical protein
MRGFASMPSRARAPASFYGGPVWKAHSARANATMIDSDNVLLRRVTARAGFPAPAATRLPDGPVSPAQPISAAICLPGKRGGRGLAERVQPYSIMPRR